MIGRFAFVAIVLTGTLLGAGACRTPSSERCRLVCAKGADCLNGKGAGFDENECVTTCSALERDAEGKKQVDEHYECVKNASGCDAIVECM